MSSPVPAAHARALALAQASLSRPGSPFEAPPHRLVLVDVAAQRLFLMEDGDVRRDFAVSTASSGVGGEDGSLRTPPGWHRIQSKIGAGAPAGEIFRSRRATGEVWAGDPVDDDLILSRVLTLDGLEEGVNRGPGRDSLARYIYLHGTNHESLLGTPASHGCVRLSNSDIKELFEAVQEGDPVVIVDVAGELARWMSRGRFHYAGLAGSGMSALAQFQAMRGSRASGSDRAFDRGERAQARTRLEHLSIRIFPQDGSGVGGDCAALVASTAIEDDVPDAAAARRIRVPIIHRSEVLAHFVATHRTLAVTGTSGKSSVVAMIFEILRGCGRDPSVITGGDLVLLQDLGLWGNAWAGKSEYLVVEADESDGSVVRYRPAVGVILNLQRDHKEMSEVAAMFHAFRGHTREALIVGEGESLVEFREGSNVFGLGTGCHWRATDVLLNPGGSEFSASGARFHLPVPGLHNVENALAAIAACAAVGVAPVDMTAPLAAYRGVGRRFQVLGSAGGVEVVDDFAHNPAKIAAALATAQARAARVLAVYQPHGYGPTRFLRRDFVETFSSALRAQDRLWMLEVFYAGGTATRDFSAADLVAEIRSRGARADFAESRAALRAAIAGEAGEGDLVLLMGARDPSLTGLAGDILADLARQAATGGSHNQR